MRADEMGFRCPECGGPMQVTETREIEHGLRRRRACRDVVCDGRLTTMELEVASHTRHDGKDMVFVRREDLSKLRDVAAALTEQTAVGWKKLSRKVAAP